MRKLIITAVLLCAALPAAADHDARIAPAWAGRDLVVQSRRLDDAASSLFREVYARNGRSPLTHDTRELAQAAQDFRRQVERGASWARMGESYRRVGNRYQRLARRLHDGGGHPLSRRHDGIHRYDWRHRLDGALRDFERAYDAAGSSLQRYAYERRDRRAPDRYAYGRRPGDAGRDDDWRQRRYWRVPGRDD